MTDEQLLEGFLARRDESAFEALLRRHGPMVLGVCRRVLRNSHDAEDAFQAAFLIFFRKAAAIRKRASLSSWLHRIAFRVALEAKGARRRSCHREVNAMPEPEAVPEADIWSDLRPLLDRELDRLPDKYREAVVLCDLQGKTRKEAARQLGVPEGTLSGRLTTARRTLAKRLSRHGVALSGGTLATVLSQGAAPARVPRSLADSTVRALADAGAGASTTVTALAEGVLKIMLLGKLKMALVLLAAATLTPLGVGYLLGPAAVGQQSLPKKVNKPLAEKKRAPHIPKWDVRATLEGHKDTVWSVTFSPDGKILATTSNDGTVRLFELATGKTLATLEGHEGGVPKAAFAPDGKTLVTVGDDKTVRIWDVARKCEIQRMIHNDPLRGAAFTPDGKTLIAWGGIHHPDGADGGGRAELRLWDPATGKERKTVSNLPSTGILNVLIAPDGKTLIISSGNRFTISDWDGKDRLKERASFQADKSGFIYSTTLSPDGKLLAVTTDAKVRLYEVATGEQRGELEKNLSNCWLEVFFSPDGKTVAAHIFLQEKKGDWIVQRRTMFRTWNVATGKVRETFYVQSVVRSAAFAPDGKTLVVGCRGGTKFQEDAKGFIDASSIVEEKDGAVKLLSRK
jgi:RNA polymerase sigma factor (sigma-70 family)